MEADHRQICKFESPACPNYLILQRAFVTTIEDLEADSLSSHPSIEPRSWGADPILGAFQRRDEYREQMKQISSFLRVEQRPDALLLAINEKQHQGSCQWLTGDDTFQQWLENADTAYPDASAAKILEAGGDNPRILWLTGRPGTGKSVVSGHVVRYLEACNLDCSFHFFRHSDRAGSTVSALLQSLAFQMAESSYEIRRAIVSLIEDGARISQGDHLTLWSKLFVDRIFKLESLKPHFWVIDAVDECPSNMVPPLVTILSKLDHTTPLRVFLTSRPGGQLERLMARENVLFHELTTGGSGSLSDMETFLQAKCPRMNDSGSNQTLLSDVLSKSNGIFLWASLIVARMEDIYSVEDMHETLETIPSEMDGFYSRITESILASPSCDLAKCILKWVICAPRPLTTSEITEAVKLDIGRTLTASSGQLETITGHLIFVDSQSCVHVAHQTTSSFLTRRREGLWIDRPVAHCRIAEVCLTTLCGTDFAPPRTRRVASSSAKKGASALASYATTHFGHHLLHSPSSVDSLLIHLNKFLRSNVLTWIERLAESGNLSGLPQTSHKLKSYLARRAKYHPPVSVEVQTVSAWVNDIHHLVAAFHSCLIASPSSIHFLIPHFCPPTSIIRQLFVKPNKRLRIVGNLEEDWSDKLTSYLLPHTPASVACCERLLAVGLDNGDIKLYDTAGLGSFGPVGTLAHGERVMYLVFDPLSSLLVSCGARKLMLWDIRPHKAPAFPSVWAQDLDFVPNQVLFDGEKDSIVLADTLALSLVSFRVSDGFRNEALLLQSSGDSDSSDGDGTSATAPEVIRACPDQRLAAIAYRNSTVAIWDLEAVSKIGKFEREGFEDGRLSPPASDLLFNPIAELELLAISYKDREVVLCNPWTQEQLEACHLPYSFDVMACTTDGRLLAGGAEDGTIHLLLFETLQPMYRIQPPHEFAIFNGLCFSADNLRFFEIRGRSCNVWEPLVLVPKDRSDDSSSEPQSEEITLQEPGSAYSYYLQWPQVISAVQAIHNGLCLVGRQDGTIDVCDGNTGDLVKKLQLHPSDNSAITHMDWDEINGILLSVDASGRCIATRLSFNLPAKDVQHTRLSAVREPAVVRQAILSPGATSVLLRTDWKLKLVAVTKSAASSLTAALNVSASFCTTHPSDPSLLIVIQRTRIHLLDWSTLKPRSPPSGIPIVGVDIPQGLSTRANTWCCGSGAAPYVVQCVASAQDQKRYLAAFDTTKLTAESKEIDVQVCDLDTKCNLHVRAIVGIIKSTMYFLDTTGWMCSVALKNLRQATHYTRHFFIPPTWYQGAEVVIEMVSKSAVVFSRGEQFVVFHGFLEFDEKVMLQVLGGGPTGLVVRTKGG